MIKGQIFKLTGENTIYRIVESINGENIYEVLEFLNPYGKWQESVVDIEWYLSGKKIILLSKGDSK